ncbi:MAG: helix-turn-helix domain-containing protein [Oscillospiraceae bacterium]|nr:helix-turn-helix domain-containing protein [Oscillospiraceae bacterium]
MIGGVAFMVDFGNKLNRLRTDKGLSQEKLAKKLNITKSMISAYENSIRLPSYDVLIKIALFFNVSIDYLFGFHEKQFLDTTNLTGEQIEILSRLIDQFKNKP